VVETDRTWLDPGAERLPGGNVGGAVRIGDTVRRPTGPWTPAVHALLDHLAGRLPGVPRVFGHDDRGREILSYLPGRVVDIDTEALSPGQIVSVLRWTRAFHEAVAGYPLAGPWRFFPVDGATMIGHNDIAPYNVCFDGAELVGVFDWDFAGPSTPLLELAFIAWNCVPLWRDVGAEAAAARLRLIADSYGRYDANQILRAVPRRIQLMIDGIPAAAGDPGMANLLTLGEPERTRRGLADLMDRIPAIERHLGGSDDGGSTGAGAASIVRVSTQRKGEWPQGVAAPAIRALNAAGYTELRQLAGIPVDDLKRLHGMGPKALIRLREALEEQGLSLG
jgi:hypothetical protein